MNDGDVVYLARQIDRYLTKVRELVAEIEEGDHPNAVALLSALRANNIDNLAWATHAIRNALAHPEWYQTGVFGIQRKRRLSDPDHVDGPGGERGPYPQVGWVIYDDPNDDYGDPFCMDHLVEGDEGFAIAKPIYDDAASPEADDRIHFDGRGCTFCARLLFGA